MKKRALLLAGGGARGAFQVGMLQELVINQGMDFQILRGVSVGSLNAAFLAQAPAVGNSQAELVKKVQELHNVWVSEITGNGSIYEERAGLPGLALGADSIYTLEPLKALIAKHISLNALMASKRDFAVGVVSLKSGSYTECRPEQFPDDFMERFLASSSIPVVFPFVDLKGQHDVLVDGGVRNVTPLSSVFRSEPDEIYILLTSRIDPNVKGIPDSSVEEYDYEQWQDNLLGTKVTGFDVLKRTIDILTDEISLDDIRRALHWNSVAEAVESLDVEASSLSAHTVSQMTSVKNALRKARKRNVPISVLAPRKWFNENGRKGSRNSSTEFSPGLIRGAIDHGLQVAADRKLWVWPPAA